jgi:hypothetical protein
MAEVAVEQDKEVSRILHKAAKASRADLEAWETALRAAVLSAGAKALAGLLEAIGSGRREEAVHCNCALRMESKGLKRKELLTILGPVTYWRSMFQCPICKRTRYPGDQELDVVGTTRSPGLRRMMARAGSKSTFKEGRDDLKVYAGIRVSAKDLARVAEGIGVPMTKGELCGRKGKQTDGSARTREVKLGCVFTQTTTDIKGFPVRDPESTSFVGAIEPAEEFGWRIYAEAVRRGLWNAQQVVVLGDGAEWIKNIADMHFHEATQIIDLYHARQHISDLCKVLFSSNEKKVVQHRIRYWTYLDQGKIEKIVNQAHKLLPPTPEAKEKAEQEIAYLEKNKERMRYADFRTRGFFVGSGVVEAGCKTIIAQRLKQSGMEWSVRGANAIIALRCMMKSGRLEDYWEDRTA